MGLPDARLKVSKLETWTYLVIYRKFQDSPNSMKYRKR